MTFTVGDRLGGYQLLELLATGGMGEVYRARDLQLERDVAIKVLPTSLAETAESRARFEREARAAASLEHPNILAVHQLGNEDGRPFMVCELLVGETLRALLARQRLEPRQAVAFASQLARGLAAAHDRGVVHRDIKPENIFISRDGRLKILDFGLARLLQPPTVSPGSDEPTIHKTTPNAVLGTFGYMSPEQARGEIAHHASDIFSFGLVFYEMLAGRRAFPQHNPAELTASLLREHPPPLSGLVPGLPPDVERLVGRCLDKQPGGRFQGTHDLVFALEALQGALEQPLARPALDLPSIAVLPFHDLSAERDQQYFCDGLADELLHALSRLAGLRVASRSSSFQFRDTAVDARTVGQRLDVTTVLEGSVRKAGGRLRINVQLVTTADGHLLWSDRFDRELADIFAIQDEIAANVARALEVVMNERERRALRVEPPRDLAAYDYYLRGRQFFAESRSQALVLARQMFERAIAKDSGYAPAWAGLADCSAWRHMWFGGAASDLARAEEASQRALELAPQSAEAHASRGLAASLAGRFEEAERELSVAVELGPRLWEAQYYFARTYLVQGKLTAAAERFEAAAEVRPDDYQAPLLLVQIYRTLGLSEAVERVARQGLELAERHLELHPEDSRALYLGATAWFELGQRARGLEWADRSLNLDPDEPYVLYNVACAFAVLGEADIALELLGKALRSGFGHREWIENDGDWDPLRADPRFVALLSSRSSAPPGSG